MLNHERVRWMLTIIWNMSVSLPKNMRSSPQAVCPHTFSHTAQSFYSLVSAIYLYCHILPHNVCCEGWEAAHVLNTDESRRSKNSRRQNRQSCMIACLSARPLTFLLWQEKTSVPTPWLDGPLAKFIILSGREGGKHINTVVSACGQIKHGLGQIASLLVGKYKYRRTDGRTLGMVSNQWANIWLNGNKTP